ncbi:MAG: nucleotidyltransferase family protein [Chloroflexales bacterium]
MRYGLFGSFVRNESRPDSDIDILVEFHPTKKTFDNFIQLAFYLEDVLGRPVDLITADSLSPYIGLHILQEVEYVS